MAPPSKRLHVKMHHEASKARHKLVIYGLCKLQTVDLQAVPSHCTGQGHRPFPQWECPSFQAWQGWGVGWGPRAPTKRLKPSFPEQQPSLSCSTLHCHLIVLL